jgi:UrcA family protein
MALAICAASAFVMPATASTPPLGTAVSFADLDLGTPAGVAALNRRIDGAANALCRPFRRGPAPWGPINFRRCVNSALASTRPQVAQAIARASRTELADRGE